MDMNKKDTLVKAIDHNLSKLNAKGKREYQAWFLYYFSMGAELINLLTEDEVGKCYVVVKNLSTKRRLTI